MPKPKVKKETSYIQEICDKVGEVALHYGFSIVTPPSIISDDISKSKQFKEYDFYNDTEEKVALTRWYMENRLDLEAQPLLLHYSKPLHGSQTKAKPSHKSYGFEIMGSNKSTSEALLIKCILAVLEDLGHKDLYIDINSIGDKESISKYERELNSHFRKQGHTLSAKARNEFKKNHYSILTSSSPDHKEFLQNAPQPVGSLSDMGRLHFKEVLECIEAFEVAYKIRSNILSNKLYSCYTIFEIRQPSKDPEGELLAYGYRYNHLAKKIGGKKDIPSMGATIIAKKTPILAKKIAIKSIKKPRFYLVQLGSTAKLKALNVVEMLRKNRIPVYHSITKDKITGQLNGAEYMRATHVLIMGQKEALENSIVVRNVANREQETVPLSRLPEFLKNLDKGKK